MRDERRRPGTDERRPSGAMVRAAGRRVASSVRSGTPSSAADWRLLGRTVRLVLGTPVYGLFATIVAALTVLVLAASRNLQFVVDVIVLGDLSLSRRLTLLRLQLPFVGGSYHVVEGLLVVVTAVLVGASTATLAYHLREHVLRGGSASTSVGGSSGSTAGVALGTLGAGCAACGPAILAGIVGVTGATGIAALPLQDVLVALPMDGLEFSVLAIGLLVLSTYWLAEGMRGGEIRGCPVDSTQR